MEHVWRGFGRFVCIDAYAVEFLAYTNRLGVRGVVYFITDKSHKEIRLELQRTWSAERVWENLKSKRNYFTP